MDPKYEETEPNKEETDQKNRKQIKCIYIAETDPKYSEIPQHFLVFEGFQIILEKRRKRTQTHFWVRFRVEAFPYHQGISPLNFF